MLDLYGSTVTYTPTHCAVLSSDLHAGALNVKGVANAHFHQPGYIYTHTGTHTHTHTHTDKDIQTLACTYSYSHAETHSSEKNTKAVHTYSKYTSTYFTHTCANGAIGKVRPTLSVLCCCQPCRHVFKQVFFSRSLTYAG